MTFIESIKSVFANYAKFDGRALRSEYWWFTLFSIVVQIALLIVGFLMQSGFLFVVYSVFALATTIPALSVCVRRLHDTDRSGWWLLLSIVPLGFIVLIVFFAQRGTVGQNRFGAESSAAELELTAPAKALNHAH